MIGTVRTILQPDADATDEAVASAIGTAHKRFGVPDNAEVRSLLVSNSEGWINAVTLLRVGFDHEPGPTGLARVGPLGLFIERTEASRLTDPQKVLEFLTSWRRAAGSSKAVDLQWPTRVYRFASRSIWGKDTCFTLAPNDKAGAPHTGVPSGPFFDSSSNHFAESFGAAAHAWVHDPQERQSSSVTNSYRIVIRDRRAMIESATLDVAEGSSTKGRFVTVVGSGLESPVPLGFGIVQSDYDGNQTRTWGRASGKRIETPVALPFQTLGFFLFDADSGEWLDRITDGFLPAHEGEPDASVQMRRLREDLDRGECDTVEFKPFIQVDPRNQKFYEVLKTVVAFANTRGGSVYIGVSDEGEVLGTTKELYRSNRQTPNSGLDELRVRYAAGLQKLLNEGINPRPSIELRWVSFVGHFVLRINVVRGESAPHHVAEDGQHWMRRGGTTKRGLPSEFTATKSHESAAEMLRWLR